ncbi:phosphonate ABC transporter [Comamonas testosteroni TK102]|uniref:Phosphonate ABC transporter n=1 Tax=Comamonas testosteroni TK102 TaxID=1392005 RepID=A0A076PVG7_COMTE|nr:MULTISPECIES: ATP-binding cassette domain-containing protein [Comamonas]AIJ47327.1 phosphonate ABC transporter [Comamonas testosteroni TK102]MPS87744.1 ATP-binding cassette domain-containing protein [Comamonas sp.]
MSFMLDDVGLTHSNGFTALSHISLSAIQGESIALIGPSGAGKTSLLSTIGTAYLPTAGRMQVLGRTAAAQSAARELKALRSRIGTVHQAAPIPLRQRVVTAVLAGKLGQWPLWKALASLAYPQDIAGAREALARVQLEDKLFARCDQLSGGQLQRVGIARVLYQQAGLILADEPVSALDPALSQATVQLLVQEAAARKATLVASLHAVDLALANFARIVGVRNGRLAFDLPAAQVSEAQLQALYAHADGSPADLPMLHNRLVQRDPASTAPAPIQVNACR